MNDDNAHIFSSLCEDLLRTTFAVTKENNAVLAGISIDLSHLSGQSHDSLLEIATKTSKYLRRVKLVFIAMGRDRLRIDMTNFPYPLQKGTTNPLISMFENQLCRDVTIQDFLDEDVHFTEDAKHILSTKSHRVTFTRKKRPPTSTIVRRDGSLPSSRPGRPLRGFATSWPLVDGTPSSRFPKIT